MDDKKFSDILKASGLISQADLERAVSYSYNKKISLYWALIEKELISDDALGPLIADYLNFPYIDINKIYIEPEILNLIPEKVAQKNHIIAFGYDKQILKLAMGDPSNLEIREFVKKKTGLDTKAYFATEKAIEDALVFYDQDIKIKFDKILSEGFVQPDSSNKLPPIAKLIDTIIEYAYKNKASDIHIEPTEENTKIRVRIDGILHDIASSPKNLHDQIASRIKVLASLRTDEHLSAQDGKTTFQTPQENLDIRVSIAPIIYGEKIVLRLLSEKSRLFTLETLGLNESDLAKLKIAIDKPHGVVLATGPTGCGKTTTIYAIVKMLNSPEKNIATIEDPVEYDIGGVNQIQVNPKTNLTFAEGLRSILRQDPDIIFVGEIRDQETAKIAINSAMTGHLVLSTVHTNDAATTLPRLLDMGIEPFLVASTVNLIIAQRLVRLICTKCVVSKQLPVSSFSGKIDPNLVTKHFKDKKTIRVSHGKGCPVCHNSGFSGRIGLFEILQITQEIRKLIIDKAPSDVIAARAIEEGTSPMVEDGLKKVEQGLTTIEEVLRVIKS